MSFSPLLEWRGISTTSVCKRILLPPKAVVPQTSSPENRINVLKRKNQRTFGIVAFHPNLPPEKIGGNPQIGHIFSREGKEAFFLFLLLHAPSEKVTRDYEKKKLERRRRKNRFQLFKVTFSPPPAKGTGKKEREREREREHPFFRRYLLLLFFLSPPFLTAN